MTLSVAVDDGSTFEKSTLKKMQKMIPSKKKGFYFHANSRTILSFFFGNNYFHTSSRVFPITFITLMLSAREFHLYI